MITIILLEKKKKWANEENKYFNAKNEKKNIKKVIYTKSKWNRKKISLSTSKESYNYFYQNNFYFSSIYYRNLNELKTKNHDYNDQ